MRITLLANKDTFPLSKRSQSTTKGFRPSQTRHPQTCRPWMAPSTTWYTETLTHISKSQNHTWPTALVEKVWDWALSPSPSGEVSPWERSWGLSMSLADPSPLPQEGLVLLPQRSPCYLQWGFTSWHSAAQPCMPSCWDGLRVWCESLTLGLWGHDVVTICCEAALAGAAEVTECYWWPKLCVCCRSRPRATAGPQEGVPSPGGDELTRKVQWWTDWGSAGKLVIGLPQRMWLLFPLCISPEGRTWIKNPPARVALKCFRPSCPTTVCWDLQKAPCKGFCVPQCLNPVLLWTVTHSN